MRQKGKSGLELMAQGQRPKVGACPVFCEGQRRSVFLEVLGRELPGEGVEAAHGAHTPGGPGQRGCTSL